MSRRNLYQSQKLKPKKSLSQVFLNTDWPVLRVAENLRSWGVKRVLEIGPGPGILTRALLAEGFDVTAVERDERFVERLEDYIRTHEDQYSGTLQVVSDDILRFDLAAWTQASRAESAVVGNIPYNISSPIVLWLLPHLQGLKGAEFLVQLEFASRLAGKVGTKAYGSLSVFTQLRAKVEMTCKVDRACFRPIPKVDSALVKLMPRPQTLDDKLLKKVELLTRTAFTQRRKMLRNAARQFLSDDLLAKCPFDLNRRPDSMRPEEFVDLAKYLFSLK